MGKLTRRAGRPIGKKIFEGPTFCRRGGHMRPGRAAKQKGSHMGVASGGAALGAVRVVQVAQKKEISGKKIVQFDEKIFLDFF